jgi:hypothetical protein
MMMNKKLPPRWLSAYYDGSLKGFKRSWVKRNLLKNPKLLKSLHAYQKIDELLKQADIPELSDEVTRKSYNVIESRLKMSKRKIHPITRVKAFPRYSSAWATAGALLIFVILIGLLSNHEEQLISEYSRLDKAKSATSLSAQEPEPALAPMAEQSEEPVAELVQINNWDSLFNVYDSLTKANPKHRDSLWVEFMKYFPPDSILSRIESHDKKARSR